MAPARIVILGGGFGGVYTARTLERLLRPGEAVVTLVNRENYWVYQPMLPEVISGNIGLTDVVSPIRRLCPRANLVMREVEAIDLDRRSVTLSPGFRPAPMTLEYDYLVIALGNVTNFYGMPGMLENAMPFRTLSDALALRNHLIHALEEADCEDSPELRRQLLTFVVGGGGFSGVEAIAELNDFIREVKSSYLRLRGEPVRCVLVQSGPRILPEMAEPLAFFAQRVLRKRGVEIVLNDRLAAATSERAILKSGVEIPAKTIVSTVPSALPPVLDKLPCAKERGRLTVDAGLALQGHEGRVWALGDCAAVKTASGKSAPPTAQHATREAVVVARNIVAAILGGEAARFTFEGLGSLGSLGRGSAVAQLFGIRLSGFVAWFLWRTVYLLKMPGFNRKVRVAMDWTIRLLFAPELAQLKTAPVPAVRRQHFEPGDIVFRQGDLGDNVYVIQSGECEVLRDGALLTTLTPGEYFGEMALLSDKTRNATVRARTAVDVVLIAKGDFALLGEAVPAFAEEFRGKARARAAGATAPPSAGAGPST
jgi:NADH dehydrogenase